MSKDERNADSLDPGFPRSRSQMAAIGGLTASILLCATMAGGRSHSQGWIQD